MEDGHTSGNSSFAIFLFEVLSVHGVHGRNANKLQYLVSTNHSIWFIYDGS